jgi:hypothetical protein
MAEHFAGRHDVRGLARKAVEANETEVADLSPAGLIAFAVKLDDPELNFPDRRRRLIGKRNVRDDHGLLLGRLQRSPQSECHFPATWRDKKLGRHAYHRVYVRAVGKHISANKAEVRDLWREADAISKTSWGFIAVLHSQLYTKAPGCAMRRVPAPSTPAGAPIRSARSCVADPIVADYFGVLLTYHTNLGLQDSATRHIVRQNPSPAMLVQALQEKALYSDAFKAFEGRVQVLAAEAGFVNHAASMEFCLHSVDKGRVHFHAFLGPAISFWGWKQVHRQIQLCQSQVVYGGVIPHAQEMKARGRNKVTLSACHGMYYVLAPKEGQLFASGTVKPHEEARKLFPSGACACAAASSHLARSERVCKSWFARNGGAWHQP